MIYMRHLYMAGFAIGCSSLHAEADRRHQQVTSILNGQGEESPLIIKRELSEIKQWKAKKQRIYLLEMQLPLTDYIYEKG